MNVVIILIIGILVFLFYSFRNNSLQKEFNKLIPEFEKFCFSQGMSLVGDPTYALLFRRPIDMERLNNKYLQFFSVSSPLESDMVIYHYFGLTSGMDNSYGLLHKNKIELHPPRYCINYILRDGYKPNFSKSIYIPSWKDTKDFYVDLYDEAYEQLTRDIQRIEESRGVKNWYIETDSVQLGTWKYVKDKDQYE